MENNNNTLGLAGKITGFFIDSKLTPLVIILSVILGVFAVINIAREEEPQIIVPMIDVFAKLPGASSREIEERVTKPLEKILWEIPGVEYVYSQSSPGNSLVTVRFLVGENEERALVRLNQKLASNLNIAPPGTIGPIVKMRSIDDVPVMTLTLNGSKYNHYQLRQIAAQITDDIKQITDVSKLTIIGGERRQFRVLLDIAKLNSYHINPMQIRQILTIANTEAEIGTDSINDLDFQIEAGDFIKNVGDLENLVVSVNNNEPIYLKNLGKIIDGGEEPSNYVFIGFNQNDLARQQKYPAVTISIAKRKATNAAIVCEQVLNKIAGLKGYIIPNDLKVTVTRDYGETATDKSNELLFHMLIAVFSVAVLIWFALGFREALIVLISIPVTLALTIFVFYMYGYTINRITLFALIFSIGILVDDTIVVLENIARHTGLPGNENKSLKQITIEATDEVGNPTILATIAVIAAIFPMAFVRGLMGPYMRPIPIGASAAMVFSLLIAFVVSPWAASRIMKKDIKHEHKEDWTVKLYRKIMTPIIYKPFYRYGFLLGVCTLFLAACSLIYFQLVIVKMLPFDNKNEFQIVIDMKDGTTIENTAKAAFEIGNYIASINEVTNYEVYIGTAAPYNFNGLVRHYYLRTGDNLADIQVNLVNKDKRQLQSHDIAKLIRPQIEKFAKKFDASVKIVEIPPGPPVLDTLVLEIYGPKYSGQVKIASDIKQILADTKNIVDVDWYYEDNLPKYHFIADQEKAALNHISTFDIVENLKIANLSGINCGLAHIDKSKEDIPILLQLPKAERSQIKDLLNLKITNNFGDSVPLSQLTKVVEELNDKSIYHKNLMRVVYVIADVSGTQESPVYAILNLSGQIDKWAHSLNLPFNQYTTSLPFSDREYSMKWDGEWHITYEVFRDLGLAFAAVLILVYILIVGWFQSFSLPFVIMAAIPFSLVGILPAHALLKAFFTAPSMIGFIAGAGIVVRNSIILIDFTQLRINEGYSIGEAVIDAGAIRFRPMLLTAAAVLVGASVILSDPIFQGLALALMAGEVASLSLSRLVIPVLFYMLKSGQAKH